jgi:hypothetical protein
VSAALALSGCDWIEEARREREFAQGLSAAIQRGKSPFPLADVLSRRWTEMCFFGAYDDGDTLDLANNNDTDWSLVAFDGAEIVAKLGSDDSFIRLNHLNQTSTCYTPQARVTIVSATPKAWALRFEDGRPWRPRR